MPNWTGPLETDLSTDGYSLLAPVPPERWPYALPSEHDEYCLLHSGGLYCDCCASAGDCFVDDPCEDCRRMSGDETQEPSDLPEWRKG